MKKWIQYLLVILIGGFFLYFVFRDVEWSSLASKMQAADPTWLIAGVIVSLVSHWIRAYRATQLYDAMHYEVKVSHSFYAVLIGYMMNYVIPRAGEVSRCAALSKTDDVPVEKSLGSVVTERIVDMVILLLILGVIFLVQFDMIYQVIKDAVNAAAPAEEGGINWKLIAALAGLTAAGLLFALRKKLVQSALFVRLFEMVQGFADGLLSIRHVKRPFEFLLWSVLIWVGYILMMYLCLFSMDATSHLSFTDCLTVFALGTIGVVLPAPGAGAGTYHFFVMQSLLLFGVPKEDGIAYATLVHGIQMIALLVIGGIASVVVLGKEKNKTANA